MKQRKWLISWTPHFYLLPSVIVMFIFVGIPILMSVYMSFFRIESINSQFEFTGLANFVDAFTNNDFLPAMGRTLVLGIFSVVTTLGGGLVLANMIANHKWLSFYRYIFYIPTVVSAITMGRLWSMMLMPSPSGLVNATVMNVFGVRQAVNWLGDPAIALYVVMGIGLVGVGGGMTLIIFTTAINNIPSEIREAASLEGANAWQMLVRITTPIIAPVISSWALLSIIGAFKSFEFIYALTGGGPAGSTSTIAIILYQGSKMSSNGYGYSASMGLLLTAFVSIFTCIYMLIANRRSNNSNRI